MDKYSKYENKYGTDKYEIRFYKYENRGNQIPINTKMEIFQYWPSNAIWLINNARSPLKINHPRFKTNRNYEPELCVRQGCRPATKTHEGSSDLSSDIIINTRKTERNIIIIARMQE